MKPLKKIFIVGVLLLIVFLVWKTNRTALEPFEFEIAGFPKVEVLDMEGSTENDLSLLGKDKYIYRINLDHKKVISTINLKDLKNPIRFARLASGDTLVIDSINDEKTNIVLYHNHQKTTKIITTLEMKINDILYSSSFGNKVALLTAKNDLFSFSIKDHRDETKLNLDTKKLIQKKYEKILSLSSSITNDSSRAKNFDDVYSLVSQKDKMIYIVGDATYKLKTNKIPNSSHPIGASLFTLKYIIIAFKNEKGVTFNAVKTPYNQKKRHVINQILDNTVCLSDNHLTDLKPIIDKLESSIEAKFHDKNKNNHHYLEHPTFEAWQHYHYVNKQETIDIVAKELGCKMTKSYPNDNRYYSGKCITPNGLKYSVGGNGDDTGEFEIGIAKDKTHCSVDFKTRRFVDFKAKSEGQNAGYFGSCKLSDCIRINISH